MPICDECSVKIGILSSYHRIGYKSICNTCFEKIKNNISQELEKQKQFEIAKPETKNIKGLAEAIQNDYVSLKYINAGKNFDFFPKQVKPFLSNLHSNEEIKAITIPFKPPKGMMQMVFITNKRIVISNEKIEISPKPPTYTNFPLSDIIEDTILIKPNPNEKSKSNIVIFKTKNSEYQILNTYNNQLENLLKELLKQKFEVTKQQEKPCPKCGFKNLMDSVFCEECGEKFDENPTNKHCPECGTLNKSKNKFCDKCGIKFGD